MKKILTAVLLLLATSRSFAWRLKGQKMIPEIAFSYLDEPIKKERPLLS